jgi:hypothetical protein|tara:strand:+ start:76 stop:1536 length:1461 start_codon:yes stop_codon:yes gene_type:complete
MINRHFIKLVKNARLIGVKAVFASAGLILVLLAAPTYGLETSEQQQAGAEPAALVGTVSLVLGRATIESGSGKLSRTVKPGSQVRVHDQIVTSTNGHVHIRFVDDALISVRPDSRLEITRYDYDPARPALSTVKFDLIEGITRAISGKAAKAARQRFRLNTPIAAIGVRGTDFTVSAKAGSTRALVNEGSIVLAPFSEDCRADAFGPCGTNSIELSSATMEVIELDGSTPLPRLVPATDAQNMTAMRTGVQQAIRSSQGADEASGAEDNGVRVEELSAVLVTDNAASDLADTASDLADVASLLPSQPEFTPEQAIVIADVADRQLIWGRYAGAGLDGQERITLSLDEAQLGREITVGNFDYGLFRSGNGSKRLDSGLTVVSFGLSSAQAFYNSSSGVVAMEVGGGTLDINFQENSFATLLNLNHNLTGELNFTASGRLFDGGYFHSRTDGKTIAGAVSLDGSEAGYFFEQQLLQGDIQGLTLWNSQ